MSMTTRLFLAVALFCGASAAWAASAKYVPLEQRLSSEQLRETGLDQLSAAQLAALNRILANDDAVRTARASTDGSGSSSREPIVGRIKGRFTGWTTGTVFTLDNGTRWKVTEGTFDARAVESPKATIKPGLLSGWYLYVDRQPVVAKVRPVP